MFKPPKVPPPPLQEGIPGARKRLAELLVVVREPDPPGAYAAIAEDPDLISELVDWPGDDAEASWSALVEKVFALAQAQRCLRCGTCCRVSSPTLYLEDLPAVRAGRLKRQSLFTLRGGEQVHSARLKQRFNLDHDRIKLRERPQGGCLLLEDHLCGDYDDRPLQCSHLECWSGRDAGDLEDRPMLSRRDLFEDEPEALALIEEFDIKLPADVFAEVLESAKVGDKEASERAMEFIELDHKLRIAIKERYGYSEREQELLFGRDYVEVVRSNGLMIRIGEDDQPVFVTK